TRPRDAHHDLGLVIPRDAQCERPTQLPEHLPGELEVFLGTRPPRARVEGAHRSSRTLGVRPLLAPAGTRHPDARHPARATLPEATPARGAGATAVDGTQGSVHPRAGSRVARDRLRSSNEPDAGGAS